MTAKDITEELLRRMEFENAEVRESLEDGRLKVDVTLPSARDLVGEQGGMLMMFQHMVRRISTKRVPLIPQVDVDINGYKKMREQILTDFAKDIAEQVSLEKRPIELKPMPSFDRRVIHVALANFSGISTQSNGEGEQRYIVVRPSL